MPGSRPKVINIAHSQPTEISGDGAYGVTGLPLLDLSEGTGQFDFRGVRIVPGGVGPDHIHDWVQANYILSGRGSLSLAGVV